MSKTRTAPASVVVREEIVPGFGSLASTGPETAEVAASAARVVPFVEGIVPSVL